MQKKYGECELNESTWYDRWKKKNEPTQNSPQLHTHTDADNKQIQTSDKKNAILKLTIF